MKDQIVMMLLAIWVVSGCQPGSNQDASVPTAENLALSWEIRNDAKAGDVTRTAVFTLSNNSERTFPKSGWKLYYSQFPNAISTLADDADLYAIENQGGDLLCPSPFGFFP